LANAEIGVSDSHRSQEMLKIRLNLVRTDEYTLARAMLNM